MNRKWKVMGKVKETKTTLKTSYLVHSLILTVALGTLIICGKVLVDNGIAGKIFFAVLGMLYGMLVYAIHQSALERIDEEIQRLYNYVYIDQSITEDRAYGEATFYKHYRKPGIRGKKIGKETSLDDILEQDVPEIEFVGEENHIPSIE